jgi:hypothetical protein
MNLSLAAFGPIQLLILTMLIFLPLLVFTVIAQWKIYEKAGKPGWASIVPVYNVIVLLEIIKKPIWWIALIFIPLVNFIIVIIIYIELAKVFSKDVGFTLGLIFLSPIFIMILGFGNAKYIEELTLEDNSLDLDIQNTNMSKGEEKILPNATAVLVLGIISIIGCVFYGIPGLVCGIIALVLHQKNKLIYTHNPQLYETSWKNSKAGYICAVIGVSISALYFIFALIFIIFAMSMSSEVFYDSPVYYSLLYKM